MGIFIKFNIIKDSKKIFFIINYNKKVFLLVKAIIDLGEREDRVLTIVKGKYGIKNKSDAINFLISKFEEDNLAKSERPENLRCKKK
jgi:hypothetical protein